jgi:hypothetical protein
LVERGVDPFDGFGGRVRDPHLRQPERQASSDRHHDALRKDLVQARAGHGQDGRVACERVEGAKSDAESVGRVGRQGRGDRRTVRDGIPLVWRVVDPDGVEPGVSGPSRPIDRVGDVAACGNSQTDATGQRSHVSPARCGSHPTDLGVAAGGASIC